MTHKVQLYRVLFYRDGSLVDVDKDATEEQARNYKRSYTDEDKKQTVTVIPPLPMATMNSEEEQASRVLPTPMMMFSFDTSIGEIIVVSDTALSALNYVGRLIGDYMAITGKVVHTPNPNNIGPVHAVLRAGDAVLDFLDPAEIAEFDHPGITKQ